MFDEPAAVQPGRELEEKYIVRHISTEDKNSGIRLHMKNEKKARCKKARIELSTHMRMKMK